MFYVYILQSLKDLSYYVGQCEDLDYRMSKHSDGQSKYSSGKRPLRLKYFETFVSRTEALKREHQIKKMKSRKYIESLIAGPELHRFLYLLYDGFLKNKNKA